MRFIKTLPPHERAELARTDAFLFDLDGTLLDSAPDLIGTLNDMLTADGLAPVAPESVRNLVSLGGRPLMKFGYGANGQPKSPADLNQLYPRFVDLYSQRLSDHSTLFPGTEALLGAIKAKGIACLLITNKPEAPTMAVIEAFNLGDYFDVVAAGNRFAFRKPDPRHLTESLTLGGLGPIHRPLMIGDGKPDIASARAAKMPSVLATYGYVDCPAAELQPDYLIESLLDLLPLVEER